MTARYERNKDIARWKFGAAMMKERNASVSGLSDDEWALLFSLEALLGNLGGADGALLFLADAAVQTLLRGHYEYQGPEGGHENPEAVASIFRALHD